ncbi:MAG TPA: hypothetical protein VHY32_08510 [Caulobacteraceae bacterium]|jgi:hypothetical protein|nr:hypothetical protein [Caulobacteraceae bacterium]
MRFSTPSPWSWRGVFLALTLVAVSMRLLAPPGFMTVAAPTGPRLVICTGHGPLTLGADRLGHSKAPPGRTKAEPPCLFAGATAAPPPLAPRLPIAHSVTIRPSSEPVRTDLTVGQTSIGAPPPARGPPGA